MSTIAVIGAGAWGTALAHVYAISGHDVLLWGRDAALCDSIAATGENAAYLPGCKISPALRVSNDLAWVMPQKYLILACPAQHIASTLEAMKRFINRDHVIVLTAKGIDIDTGHLLSDIVTRSMPDVPCAVLTGPTFAKDLARGLPAAATLACADAKVCEETASGLMSRTLRLYTHDDIAGAQVGGAVKNVIAIACGIVEGLSLGESARAALITRGLAEIGRLAVAMGGKRETLLGLCGVGDMVLTCNSLQSRNFSFGHALGSGQKVADILASRKSVTEGVHTARAIVSLAARHNVDMPISRAVYNCVHGGASVHDAVADILERPTRAERE